MSESKVKIRRFAVCFRPGMAAIFLLLILAAGCGAGDEEEAAGGEGGNRSGAVPTMPAARFDQPTPVTDMEEASEADRQEDEAAAAEEPDIATGEFVYGNRCQECHGEGATGTEQGASLIGLTLGEDDFEDLIRTGGELGPDHLFGSTRISPEGLKAVYAYLTSLE